MSSALRYWRQMMAAAVLSLFFVTIIHGYLNSRKWITKSQSNATSGCVCPPGSPVRPRHSHLPVRSNCGPWADQAGPRQNVIAFSFFGDTNSSYFSGLQSNAELMPRFYPGWRIRVYTALTPDNNMDVCSLHCTYPYMDFCDVGMLPDLGDLRPWLGSIWRFMVLADPSVERFVVRDSDSPLTQRGRDAVDEWIASGLIFHAMRDHPQHGAAIMGGMWGGWNHRSERYGPEMRQKIINATKDHDKFEDQAALKRVLWPVMLSNRDVLQHDSYTCERFPGSVPFPSRRSETGDFIGAPNLRLKGQRVPTPCPEQCRPVEHQDWEFC